MFQMFILVIFFYLFATGYYTERCLLTCELTSFWSFLFFCSTEEFYYFVQWNLQWNSFIIGLLFSRHCVWQRPLFTKSFAFGKRKKNNSDLKELFWRMSLWKQTNLSQERETARCIKKWVQSQQDGLACTGTYQASLTTWLRFPEPM